jgi:hypothetical protein
MSDSMGAPATDEVIAIESRGTVDLREIAGFTRQRYLLALAAEAEVAAQLRNQLVEGESPGTEALVGKWRQAQAILAIRAQIDAGIAEQIKVGPLPEDVVELANRLIQDPTVRGAFRWVSASVAMVEIDKLVVGQRSINLDYVAELKARFSGRTTPRELVEHCLGPSAVRGSIRHLEPQAGVHVFSSDNPNLRVLGTFVKHGLGTEDAPLSANGGDPVAAVATYVGFGVPAVSVFEVGSRRLLNNGNHRLYALRELGVTEVPAIVQHVSNVGAEVPPVLSDVPSDQLLLSPRPPLLADFFNDDLAVTIPVRKIMRVLTVVSQVNAMPVPSS